MSSYPPTRRRPKLFVERHTHIALSSFLRPYVAALPFSFWRVGRVWAPPKKGAGNGVTEEFYRHHFGRRKISGREKAGERRDRLMTAIWGKYEILIGVK